VWPEQSVPKGSAKLDDDHDQREPRAVELIQSTNIAKDERVNAHVGQLTHQIRSGHGGDEWAVMCSAKGQRRTYGQGSVEGTAHRAKVDERGHVADGLEHGLELLHRAHQEERAAAREGMTITQTITSHRSVSED
jgi:hypothetical protein